MICHRCWVGIFKQHSVNKIAFIVLRGEFEAVGSRSDMIWMIGLFR